MKERYYLVCFDSSQKAIKTEFNAKEIISEARLIPIPSEIRANCGLGLKVSVEKLDLITDIIENNPIYEIERADGKRKVKLIDLL